MKLFISLAILNGSSAQAIIDLDDGISIDLDRSKSPREACQNAAKTLREAALRFELLAKESEPFQASTHERINNTKVTVKEVGNHE
ncbi:hypothetical protein [Methylophilus sp. QUAN]|uniref:hypothetical protein n=1 Tax=Methylophilus sp. QUAN TaxID=2781020 RepID=UPI00188F1AD4|nr:hypothetical protein [Methylophilus sp. QUAN]MBF4990659.1 hypothetical protein [Methylophilus sp. QUAN]